MAAEVLPGDFLADGGYPGSPPAGQGSPWLVDAAGPFRPQDASRFWFLDFHWPRGLTPLGMLSNEDGYCWGTQSAAEALPLPRGRGIAVRTAGTHTYAAEILVTSKAEVAERASRVARALPRFLRDFPRPGPHAGRRSTTTGTTCVRWTCPARLAKS